MKVLLTGANGYIGSRLLLLLGEAGHHIVALVRSKSRISVPNYLKKKVTILEGDLLQLPSIQKIPVDIEVAYYLVHSMGQQSTGFLPFEAQCAQNFNTVLSKTKAKQVIYLSGLSQKKDISEHMSSRHNVETILRKGKIPVTVLRAGIIVGSGSASFEIMRDLVEKLPVMVGPKWVRSKCQPIAIRDVLFYLHAVCTHPQYIGKAFDLGGPDILTYRDMLLQFAKVRGLKRWIIPIPFLTPHLSSLWLFLITSTHFSLAKALVNSLKTDAICTDISIRKIIPHSCLHFNSAIKLAFEKVEQNAVLSSWKDAMIQSKLKPHLLTYIKVPHYGCVKNVQCHTAPTSKEEVLDKLWRIGGDNGWYYMNWAWTLRGWMDRLVGGVGLRRGRTHSSQLHNGDTLDFWRVITANRTEGHLLLYAEMRLPGEAWLEWKVEAKKSSTMLTQTATFRPKGILGRLYWYSLSPFHVFIFHGLCTHLMQNKEKSR